MRSLAEAEIALRAWDKKNWHLPPGNSTARYTSLHLAKAVFRALAKAERLSGGGRSSHDHLLQEFFNEMAGRLIEHSLRLCRAFDRPLTGILLASCNHGCWSAADWANRHGDDAADDMGGTFAALMDGMTLLTALLEREGHEAAVNWRLAFNAVPLLMRGALGASVNLMEGDGRFIAPFRERLAELELAKRNEYAAARA